MFFSFFQTIRLDRWWLYKASPLLGIAYLFIYMYRLPLLQSAYLLLWYLVALTGIASMGYFINDFFDRQTDIRAGKKNFLAGLSAGNLFMIFILLIILSVVPWFYLPHTTEILILVVLELILFIAYSGPPFRFKKSAVAGVFCDAMYGHVIPLLLTSFIFYTAANRMNNEMLIADRDIGYIMNFIKAACAWQMLKGIRNILIHQVEDRRNDRRSGIRSLAVRFGPVFTAGIINTCIIPLEFISFVALMVILAKQFIALPVIFGIFLVWNFFTLEVWKKGNITKLRYKNRFFYCLNDFYEMWMPVIFLLYLLSINIWYTIVLLVHLVLFRKTFQRLKGDIRGIRNLMGL